MKTRKPIMYCSICERDDVPEREMNRTGFCCLLCERDYVNYRRGFKAEFGRWPTMAEFKFDNDE